MNNLTSSQDNLTQGNAAGEEKRLDRRGVLRYGGAAALAGAAAAVIRPSIGGAADATGVMHFGVRNAAGVSATGVTSSNATVSLRVSNAGLGDAIVGEVTNDTSAGNGVVGNGINGAGVVGATRGNGPGVRAVVEPGARGSALHASTEEPFNAAPTMSAAQAGTGHGVYSHIENPANAARAVYARTVGTGHAVLADVANANNAGSALRASTSGTGPGVEGVSAAGVGGSFSGKTAQVRLVPSSAPSHPSSGSAGQLFVDSAERLWFCRGGTNWKRLA